MAAALEWAQLVRRRPLPGAADLARAVAVGWMTLPLSVPARLVLPLLRRAAARD